MEEPRASGGRGVGFTAAVSHELRTPLARLLALLESASLPDADSEALLAQAREQVEEMSELVDDVLFLSELESGREVVALGSTAALPVLEDVRDRLADRAQPADVAVRIEADRDRALAPRPPMVAIVLPNHGGKPLRYAGRGPSLARSSPYLAACAAHHTSCFSSLAFGVLVGRMT